MVNLFIDTSVLIEEARRGSEIWKGVKLVAKEKKVVLMSSVVVLTELWSGESMGKKEDLIAMEEIIKVIIFVDLNQKIAKMAGEIARNYGIKGFDALIAATALIHKAELVTLNTKCFKNVKGLKLYNETL